MQKQEYDCVFATRKYAQTKASRNMHGKEWNVMEGQGNIRRKTSQVGSEAQGRKPCTAMSGARIAKGGFTGNGV